jgi:hypothetical protein
VTYYSRKYKKNSSPKEETPEMGLALPLRKKRSFERRRLES